MNGTSLRVQFDYNFTEGSEEGLNYTQHGGILFPNGERGWYDSGMTMPKGWDPNKKDKKRPHRHKILKIKKHQDGDLEQQARSSPYLQLLLCC